MVEALFVLGESVLETVSLLVLAVGSGEVDVAAEEGSIVVIEPLGGVVCKKDVALSDALV